MTNNICKKCKNIVTYLEEFPSKDGGIICQECYIREFEELTEEEKKPDFIKTINKI